METEILSLQRTCGGWECNSQFLKRDCPRCNLVYCPHYASKIDFQYCQYCFHDLVLEDSIIRRIEETKSLSGKKIFTRVMRARHLVFKGQDWMFAQARVVDMTDEELGVTIEYHKAIFGEMINEREARKIAANRAALNKMHKNAASMKIPSKTPGLYTDGTAIEAGTSVVTTTTVKRTRTTIPGSNSIQNALAGVIATWKAMGLSEDQIKAKLGAMIAGGK
jgi:hypothetical protein